MNRFLSSLFIFLCLQPAVWAGCRVTDAAGQTFSLSQPAQRIISLSPDITETLFAIGASQQVVGVIHGSDYPAAARMLPQVGSYTGLDLERILSLHPDLVIVWGQGFSRQLAVLRQMRIPVYVTQPKQLEDVPLTMRKLGCLTGHSRQAEAQARQFEWQLQVLQANYHKQKPVKVFYQIGSYSLMTINQDSWINQVITVCGGENVFAHAATIAPEISWEAAVAANPEVIISDSATNADWCDRWQRWSTVSAVKHHRLYAIHPDWIDRPGPRLVLGVAEVCKLLK